MSNGTVTAPRASLTWIARSPVVSGSSVITGGGAARFNLAARAPNVAGVITRSLMVGCPTDKTTIDARAGSLAVALRDTLADIVTVKGWLDSQTDTQLLGLGYVQAEVTLLRAAFTDMLNLSNIAHASGTQPAAYDFFINAKRLMGLS